MKYGDTILKGFASVAVVFHRPVNLYLERAVDGWFVVGEQPWS
jgi:hypothetical protein